MSDYIEEQRQVIVNMTVDKDALKRMAFKLIEENDFVKVVRCKDCKHRERCYSAIVMTKECKGDTFFKDIDYCSEGKLKEQE